MAEKPIRADRPRRRASDQIDAWLWSWGAWVITPVPGIGYPSESTEYRIRNMQIGSERRKVPRKKRMIMMQMADGTAAPSPLPNWYELLIGPQKSTRSMRPMVPLYSAHPRQSRINSAVLELRRDLRLVVAARYIHDLNVNRGSSVLGITRDQYYGRLDMARTKLRLALDI